MDATLLKTDEVQVELEIRKIPANDPQCLQKLQEILAAEVDGTKVKPIEMTNRASRKPDAEIEICCAKLEVLRDNILTLDQVLSNDLPKEISRIQTRLLHTQGRLERALSTTARSQASNTLKSCKELMDSIDKYITKNESLNSSLESAKLVEIPQETAKSSQVSSPVDATDVISPKLTSEIQNQRVTFMNQETIAKVDHPDANFLVQTLVNQVQRLSEQIGILSTQQQDIQNKFALLRSGNVSSNNEKIFSNHSMRKTPIQTASTNYNPIHSVNPTSDVPLNSNTINPLLLLDVPSVGVHQSLHNGVTVPSNNAQGYLSGIEIPNNQTNIRRQEQSQINNVAYQDRSRSFARSGITFDGSPNELPADLFILQVETLASSIGISQQSLLNEVSFVLRGTALHWYWSYRRNNPNLGWSQLRATFLIWSFLQFYQHVWSLTLQCHSPYPEDRLIEVLMRNMNPQLQYHLTDRYFTNINDLIKSCAAWENTWSRLKVSPHYTPFARPTINELNYCEQNYEFNEMKETPPVNPTIAALKPANYKVSNSTTGSQHQLLDRQFKSADREAICYNCCDLGHTFRECALPQGLFCYRCGYRNTTSPQCPRCMGNSARGQWRSGITVPPKTPTPRESHINSVPVQQPPLQILTRGELNQPNPHQTTI